METTSETSEISTPTMVEAPLSNGHATLNGTAPKKIKNKAALKRAKQKERRKNVSRQTSVVRSMMRIEWSCIDHEVLIVFRTLL